MFKPHYAICVECNLPNKLIVVKKGYCDKCNYELKQQKKGKKPKYNSMKYCKKPTGEKQVFKEIWDERPHVCINCLVYLGSEAKASYFMHLLSKKQNEYLRLDKTNIELGCFNCHYELDHGTIDKFISRNKNKKFLESETMVLIIEKRKSKY